MGWLVSAGLDARLAVSRGDSFTLDIRLTIAPGRTIALLGPNAAGKSTTVAALAGLLPLEQGHISLDERCLDDPGRNLFVPPDQRGIGVVFQDYLLFPHLSIAENVAFGLRRRDIARSAVPAMVDSMLEQFGLGQVASRRPADLSGGQAQRVALARALITEPRMLLLDEPLAALDVTTRAQLRHMLAHYLRSFPGPRLLITHDPTEALLLADEIHVIEGGTITQVGSPDDIRLRPRTRYVADLAGSNLLEGTASGGVVTLPTHQLAVADTAAAGPVLATIHPRAISVHRNRPGGSPRNSWRTDITRIEHYGDRVRLQTGAPLALTAEVTPGAATALELVEGLTVWVSLKATEITLEED